jgi:excisionase family DNA binding protein
MTMSNANFLTIVEASAKLGKSPRTIHRWVEEGRLPGHKVDVDGHLRWVVDIDKVRANDYAMPKPPDVQAELLDLTEEVAWLKEQLQAKDKRIHELRRLLPQDAQIPELQAPVQQFQEQPRALPRPKKWYQFWRRR